MDQFNDFIIKYGDTGKLRYSQILLSYNSFFIYFCYIEQSQPLYKKKSIKLTHEYFVTICIIYAIQVANVQTSRNILLGVSY